MLAINMEDQKCVYHVLLVISSPQTVTCKISSTHNKIYELIIDLENNYISAQTFYLV
jgi:hypothetical protein